MKLKMIFFDFGGTLDVYPSDKAQKARAAVKVKRMLEEAGAHPLKDVSESEFEKTLFDGLSAYYSWRKEDCIELPPEEIFERFILNKYGIEKRISDEFGEKAAFIIETDGYHRSARPEAKEAMEMLRAKNIPLGIISNIISRGQVPYSLESYGLTEYFNPVILSATYGKRKPHPGIFRHACEKAGVDIRDAMYVGNSPSKDIDGAKNAGMGKTVLIEYFDNDPHDTGAQADFTIKDLRELIPIAEELL